MLVVGGFSPELFFTSMLVQVPSFPFNPSPSFHGKNTLPPYRNEQQGQDGGENGDVIDERSEDTDWPNVTGLTNIDVDTENDLNDVGILGKTANAILPSITNNCQQSH